MSLEPSTLAGLITAGATVATALVTILGALPLILRTYRQSKEIHKIVNQQRTDLVNYQAALIKTLRNAHIDIPDDQSMPDSTADTERKDNGRQVL